MGGRALGFMPGAGEPTNYGATLSPADDLDNLQNAIEKLGFRRYHLWLLLASWSFQLCASAVAGALPFMQKSMRQEFSLSNADIALLSSALLLGAIPGVWIFGPAMDRVGRKPAISIMVVGIAVSSASHQLVPVNSTAAWPLLLAIRFVAGIFFGALASFNHLVLLECLPTCMRGILVCVSQQGWSLSAFYVMFMSSWAHENWRWLTLAPLPCCFLAFLAVHLMPESPRWLFINGHMSEAMQLVHRFESSAVLWEGSASDVAALTPEGLKKTEVAACSSRVQGKTQLIADARTLFGPKYCSTTACMIGIFVAANGAGNALGLFMPQIVQDKLGTRYMPYALFATSEALALLGFLMACWFLDSSGRRLTLASIFGFTGFFTVMWLILPLSYWCVVALEISRNVAAAGMWPVMMTFEGESFPTTLRGTGSAICHGAGRTAAIVMPAIIGFVLDGSFAIPGVPDHKLAPFLLVALMYWLGLVMSVLSPQETANAKLQDV